MASPRLSKEQIINMILRGELPLDAFINEEKDSENRNYVTINEDIDEKQDGEAIQIGIDNSGKKEIVIGVVKKSFNTILDNGEVLGPLIPGDLVGLNRELYNRLKETGVVEEVEPQ